MSKLRLGTLCVVTVLVALVCFLNSGVSRVSMAQRTQPVTGRAIRWIDPDVLTGQSFFDRSINAIAASRQRDSRQLRANASETETPTFQPTAQRAAGNQRTLHLIGSRSRSNSAPSRQRLSDEPEVVPMIGPVDQPKDLRDLPYIAPSGFDPDANGPLHRNPPVEGAVPLPSDPERPQKGRPSILPNMPTPSQTFAGMSASQACNGCVPPDTDGDVGPNNYIQSVNSSIRIHDKSGAVLSGPTTYNSFFSALGASTPCGTNLNDGDGIVFYDHLADRWIVSDFAFGGFPGTAFYQCIGVSKTSDPVAGGWWLYANQVDPANINFLGDYPKFGMWTDGYYMAVNEFSDNTTFNGVRVYAFDRASMINGGNANTIAFSILPGDLGDQYSLVPASFRTGDPPPAGRPEFFFAINSTSGTSENSVFVYRFHADFSNPANSTFGAGASHTPDGTIAVASFVDGVDNTGSTNIVPNGTATSSQRLDTLGDKLMYPLIYQNLGGVESIYAVHTVNDNQNGTGPTGVGWYQFDVSGNTIPAVPAQQQNFTNGADGLWRWMPSINVDAQGNMAIGYSTSSSTVNPHIRWAGRLPADPLSTLGQGESTVITAAGHQTGTGSSARWGDYSTMFVDPVDNCTFFHTNEFYSANSASSWNTEVGSFKFPGCVAPAHGTAHFAIANCATSAVIGSALIKIDGIPYGATKANGTFDILLAPGNHTYTALKNGSTSVSGNFTITAAQTTNVNACLSSGTAHIVLTDCGTNQPISGGAVTIDGSGAGSTAANGVLDVAGIPGNHTYSISKANYTTGTGPYTLTDGQTTTVNVCLNGLASVAITQVADSAAVSPGAQIGSKITITNTGAAAATGLSFTDALPSGNGISWVIDPANSTAGWSVSGAAPNQALVYSPTTLAAGTNAYVHVVSATSGSCSGNVALGNTASFSTGNDGSGSATVLITIFCPPGTAGPVTVTATSGTVGPTDYPTLKAAFDAINAGTHQGALAVWIAGNTTETASAVLSASGTGASSYSSMIMLPSGGARTISGAIAAGSPLVDLNGADNVTIDGQSNLTFANTTVSATSGTSTIRLIGGATNNVIKNATILGSATSSVTAAGGDILISTSTVAGGNSNNTIANNNIGPAGSNLPTKGVMGLGTAANPNLNNVVDNNNIFDFFSATVGPSGVSVQGNNNNWTISNNNLYQTAARTFTSAQTYAGITITSSGNAFSVIGNRIGFGASNGTGTTTISGSSNQFKGLNLTSVSTSTPTSVQGNTISGINQTSAQNSTTITSSVFTGMSLGAVDGRFNVGDVSGNTIGSLDGSSTISLTVSATTAGAAPVLGILDFSLQGNVFSNNNIGSFTIQGTGTVTGFRGLFVDTASGTNSVVSNNTFAKITDSLVGNYAMTGALIALANGIVTGNSVHDLVGSSNGASIVAISGLNLQASTGINAVTKNSVYSLSNTSGAGSNSIYGISCSFPAAANIIERNLVHSLSMTSSVTTGQLVGIIVTNALSTTTVQNNMVRLGVDSAGNAVTTGVFIAGLWDNAGTNKFLFNSSFVGGSGVASASNSYALFSQVTTNNRSYVDNILYNARDNGAGIGKNYAIAVAGAGTNPAGLTSNSNDLFASGNGSFVGLYNTVDEAAIADWRTATGQDASSISSNPAFIAPLGTAATVDLHIGLGSATILAGTPIAGISNDFDNDARGALPDIGADEVIAQSDISVLKTDGVSSVQPGNLVVYSITVTNNGPSPAVAVNVNDNVPAVLTGASWVCSGAGGGTCTANGVGSISQSVNLPASSSVTFVLATLLPGATGPGVLSNTASASLTGGAIDPVGGNNSSTDVDVIAQKESTTTVTSAPNPSVFGQSVVFTATVAAKPPASGTPTGTVNFNVDGTIYCPNTAINGAGVATCTVSGLPSLGVALSPHAVVVNYSGDANFNGSVGSLTGGQAVTKAVTVTTITNAASLGTSGLVNQGYAVNWSTTVTAPGAGTPTGNVTVSDGTATCTAPLAAGTCNLASTTIGNPKTITAVYAGDANFTGSTSTGVSHVVNLSIGGTILRSGLPLSGVSVTLAGTNGSTTTTNASGAYSFVGQLSGSYTVTPTIAGKTLDPLSRLYTSVLDNITNANFNVYDNSGFPRTASITNAYTVPGQSVVVPVVINALGNEAKMTFNIGFDTNVMLGAPVVTCGTDVPGCTMTTNALTPGRIGITLTPPQALAAGQRQLVKLTFQTLQTSLSNTPVTFEANPLTASLTDASNDPLGIATQNGFVVFQQGLEGDVAGQHAGDAQILANDVTIERNLVAGTSTPDPTFNEFQRADAAPKGTLGDGVLNAADVVQVRRFVLGLDTPTAAGGPFTGNPGGPIAPEDTSNQATPAGRALKVTSTNAVAGSKVSVDVTLDAAGNETAASFDVGFDAMKLSNPTVTLGGGAPADTTLTVNTADSNTGRIRVLIDSSNSFEKADAKQVVTITFDVAGSAPTGDTEVSLSNGSLSDTEATDIPVSYTSGKVTINGNSTGVTLSGRVVTPEGAGLRAAIVTLTDSKGSQRVVTTSSLGFYSFDTTLPGEYTITVASKRYRFTSRTIQASDNLADLDFVGAE